MSSGAFTGTLQVDRGPSRRLVLWLSAIHAGTASMLPWLGLSLAWALGLLTAIAVSLYLAVSRQALLRDAGAVVRLVVDEDDAWTLVRRDGRALTACLLPAAYVHPRLIVLNFRDLKVGRPYPVVLPGDAVDAESHRRLRARLKNGAWDDRNRADGRGGGTSPERVP